MIQPVPLSALCLLLQETLRQAFQYRRFWVLAEISNHSFYPQKGFHYFDLVEKAEDRITAKIAGVAWAAGARSIAEFEQATGEKFRNGLALCLEMSFDFHPVYGLKLTLLQVDTAYTLGRLELAKQAVVERLLAQAPDMVWMEDGRLTSFNRALQLPQVIQRIAVVASRQSAGYGDFRHSLEENAAGYRFVLDPFYTLVQGEENAAGLAAVFDAIREKSRGAGVDYDAVVLIRGGGAQTDLLLFDQFDVALAVASCPFPVLTGIGHLKNESLADRFAHTPLKTPTQVAEFILQQNAHFENALLLQREHMLLRTQQWLRKENDALQTLQHQLTTAPRLLLQHRHSELRLYRQRLEAGSYRLLQNRQKELENTRRICRLASPERTLERGFAWIEKAGRIQADGSQLTEGDAVRIVLKDKTLDSRIEKINPRYGTGTEL